MVFSMQRVQPVRRALGVGLLAAALGMAGLAQAQSGTPIRIHVGEPFTPAPGSDPVVVTAELKARMSDLLDHARATYAGAPRSPDDTWWVPKALGGTAPTIEEAAVLNEARKAERAARKAAKKR